MYRMVQEDTSPEQQWSLPSQGKAHMKQSCARFSSGALGFAVCLLWLIRGCQPWAVCRFWPVAGADSTGRKKKTGVLWHSMGILWRYWVWGRSTTLGESTASFPTFEGHIMRRSFIWRPYSGSDMQREEGFVGCEFPASAPCSSHAALPAFDTTGA